MSVLSIICIIIVILFTIAILILVILEYKEECKLSNEYRTQVDEMRCYVEIYDMEDEGLCESCSYGKDRCLSDGKAHCKIKEKENGKEKSV